MNTSSFILSHLSVGDIIMEENSQHIGFSKPFINTQNIKDSKEQKTTLITLDKFKTISRKDFDSGKFEKLGQARESLAKELGFDCYRAYKRTFEEKYKTLLSNVMKIVTLHKTKHNPVPIVLVIDIDIDYINLLKTSLKKDFDYFSKFNIDELFLRGKEFSEINVYGILSQFQYDNCDEVFKANLKIINLKEDGTQILMLSKHNEIKKIKHKIKTEARIPTHPKATTDYSQKPENISSKYTKLNISEMKKLRTKEKIEDYITKASRKK